MANHNVANAQSRTRRATSSKAPAMRYRPVTKRNANHPTHRLPFVARGECGLNFWAFPRPSCYMAGHDLGKAAALAFLKALRETPKDSCPDTMFSCFATSAIAAGGDHTDAARHGIACGFFGEVSRWVNIAVELLGDRLDTISEAELSDRMTAAARKTPAEVDAEIMTFVARANREQGA